MTTVQLSIGLNTSAAVLNANALVAAIRPLITLSPRAAGAVGGLSKSLAKFGTGTTGILIAEKLIDGTVKLTQSALDTANRFDLLSKQTGIQAEQLQRFQFVASNAGLKLGDFSKGVGELSTNLGLAIQGDKDLIESFGELGFSFEDLIAGAGNFKEFLIEILDRLNELPTAMEKAASGSELFGKAGGATFAVALAAPSAGLREELFAVSESSIIPEEEITQGAAASRQIDTRLLQIQRSLQSGNLQFGAEALEDLAVTLGDPAFLRGLLHLGQASGVLVDLGASGADIILESLAPALGATFEAIDVLPEKIDNVTEAFERAIDAIGRASEKAIEFLPPAIDRTSDDIIKMLREQGIIPGGPDPRPGPFLPTPDDGPMTLSRGSGAGDVTGGIGGDRLFASSASSTRSVSMLLGPEQMAGASVAAEERIRLLNQEVSAITDGGLPALEALERQRRRAGEVAAFRAALIAETAGMTDQTQVVERLTARYGFLAEARDGALEQIARQQAAEARLASSVRQLGFTFTSAFEDAVIEGRDLSDVLQSLGDDIQRVLLRTLVTEPLFGGLADVIGGGLEGGLFASLFSGGAGAAVVPGSAATAAVGPLSTGFGFMTGGLVGGPGTATSDSVLARLSSGEFVISAARTREFLPVLQAINSGALPAMQSGGLVFGRGAVTPRFDEPSAERFAAPGAPVVRRPAPPLPATPFGSGFSKEDSRHLADLARTARMQRHQMMIPRKAMQIPSGDLRSQRQILADLSQVRR